VLIVGSPKTCLVCNRDVSTGLWFIGRAGFHAYCLKQVGLLEDRAEAIARTLITTYPEPCDCPDPECDRDRVAMRVPLCTTCVRCSRFGGAIFAMADRCPSIIERREPAP
jgi:hypothetical protein